MSLTETQWTGTEKPKLVSAISNIQGAIDDIDAAFAGSGGGSGSITIVLDETTASGSPVFSNSDLTVAAAGSSGNAIRSNASRALSKRRFRFHVNARGTSGFAAVGVVKDTQSLASPPTGLASVPAGMWLWRSDGYKANNGSYSTLGSGWTTSDYVDVAFDDAGNLWFGLNGTWIGDPVAGTGAAFTGLTGNIGACIAFFGTSGSPQITIDDTGGTMPTGYEALGA